MKLYDLNGKLIKKTDLHPGTNAVDLCDISHGIYIVSIQNSQGNIILNEKIILTHN